MAHTYPLSFPTASPIVSITNPQPHLWVLELHNGHDNRLTHVMASDAILPALDAVEKHWREKWMEYQTNKATKGKNEKQKDIGSGSGALIIVGKKDQDKFFSNGLDFAKASTDLRFFTHTFNPVLARLLTFPIPTIAAINGHGFAAGFILALACDYRVMVDGATRNAWLSMNEVHFGAALPLSLSAVINAKGGSPQTRRAIALEGHRFTPTEALNAGLVDHIVSGGFKGVMEKAAEVAARVAPTAKEGSWGLIKETLYKDALDDFKKDLRIPNAFDFDRSARARL